MKHTKKLFLIIVLLAVSILFLTRCITQAESKDPRGKLYAGVNTCRQCHQAIYDSFISTAHFNATSIASSKNILGNFNQGKNIFNYDSSTKVVMEKRDSGYYQVLYVNTKEVHAYRYDILFGNQHAQTSVFWKNDQLFELPISHFNEVDIWGTSPGFPSNRPYFTRMIDADCFDCHSSNLNIKNSSINEDPGFDKQSLIYGIDCERCHGPAQNHVNYHLDNPGLKTASYITKYSSLSHGQKMDACAVCHSGNDKAKIQSRFLFKMGDTLGYFFMPFGGRKTVADVHGNQYSLLAQSKCFNLNTMTCGTCHDPHKNADQTLATYSQKCMTCHKQGSNNFCPQYSKIGESIKNNCIDCHMPKKASNAISYQLQQSSAASPYLLRTHRIAIYGDSIKNIYGNQSVSIKK